jgi:hypothetical protein
MNKKLTSEQVAKLYAYCHKMEIYDFDVQIEIVDHLASAIEKQGDSDSTMTFGWALKNILQRFGKNGLKKMERQFVKQMKLNFNRILFIYFIEFYRIPKIIITVLLALGLFVLLQVSSNNMWVVMPFCIFFSVAGLIYYYKIFPEKFDVTEDGKTYMIIAYLKNINARAGSIAQLPFLGLLFSNAFNLRYSNNFWTEMVISILLSCFAILLYAYFIYLPTRLKNYFESNYIQFAE